MGEFGKWLLHEDQKDLFELLFACVLNIVFLSLVALLLWPLGSPMLAWRLAKGYSVLWGMIYLAVMLVGRIQAYFRVNIYDHPDAFVYSNLAVTCILQAGWAAFTALIVHNYVGGTPLWLAVSLYLVGGLSCLVAFIAVSAFYQGHVYKFISLPFALVCFVVFSVWPAIGRTLFGWFFDHIVDPFDLF
jgi:hypothetical protein